MNIEAFYNVIRTDKDPVDFATIKQADRGTRYFLDIFKKHGNKDFFLSWNWAAFFAPTTFGFYRKLYLFWGLKMLVFVIAAILVGILTEKKTIAFYVMFFSIFFVQRIIFASIANSLYINKITKKYKKDKRYRLKPTTAGGLCGFLIVPGWF
jgi:cellulose synthase/poly-beta-1,6-N-acetylglucosamine synthase-like glycosyltransferase